MTNSVMVPDSQTIETLLNQQFVKPKRTWFQRLMRDDENSSNEIVIRSLTPPHMVVHSAELSMLFSQVYERDLKIRSGALSRELLKVSIYGLLWRF
jgi:hypothetical protein